MSTTQGRTGRSRAVSAVVLLVSVVAAMLAQGAFADTASAAVHRQSATAVTINHNAWVYDVGTVPISGAIIGNGRYLGGATVEIWTRPTTAVGTWTHIANARSNSAGRYSVNITATEVRYYQARFAGTYSWFRSASPVIHLYARRIGTRFASTTMNNTSVGYGGGTDIRGVVVDARGARVAGQRVQLFGLPAGRTTWVLEANANTSATGSYIFSPRHQVVTISYQVRFAQTVKWTASMSPAVRLTVGKLSTTVAAAVLHPMITTGAAAMVTGTLSDALGRRLAAQRVEIWSKTANSTNWADLGPAVTNSYFDLSVS